MGSIPVRVTKKELLLLQELFFLLCGIRITQCDSPSFVKDKFHLKKIKGGFLHPSLYVSILNRIHHNVTSGLISEIKNICPKRKLTFDSLYWL